MAWVKVIKKFRDKNTDEIHEAGEKLNLRQDRINEILEAGEFIEELKKEEKKEKDGASE